MYQDLRLETVNLTAECVPLDVYVHQVQAFAVEVRGLLRHNDHAGAGSPHRAVAAEVSQRLQEVEGGHEPGYRGAFAAGNDYRVEALKIGRKAHLLRRDSEAREGARVLGEIT